MARIDMNGDGAEESEDSLTALGFTHEERTVLGGKYSAGASVMRALTSSFSPIDLNYPVVVEPDISPEDDPEGDEKDSSKCKVGCEIDANNQTMRERIKIPGTELELVYNSEEVEGWKTGRLVRFNLWTDRDSSNLVEVRYSVNVAGRILSGVKTASELFSGSNYEVSLLWDGLDAWGRKVHGRHQAIAYIDYVLSARIGTSTRGFSSAGAMMSTPTSQSTESRINVTRSRVKRIELSGFSSEPQKISGWSLKGLETIRPDQLSARSVSRRSVLSREFSPLIKVAGGGAIFADSGIGEKMAFSDIVDIISNSEDVIYFLTSPYTMGRIDSSRVGIWETSSLGARVKRIYPNANTVVGPCDRAVPKQLAIGPFGNILFYAVDWMDPYTTNPFICSLDPKSGLTSVVGYLPHEPSDAGDMIYVKTRGVVLSYGDHLKQLKLDGSYSEIPDLDHKSIYSLATSNAGNLCRSTFQNGLEEMGVDDSIERFAGASANVNSVRLYWYGLRSAPSDDVQILFAHGICQQKNGDWWYANDDRLVRVSNGWAELIAGHGNQSVYTNPVS